MFISTSFLEEIEAKKDRNERNQERNEKELAKKNGKRRQMRWFKYHGQMDWQMMIGFMMFANKQIVSKQKAHLSIKNQEDITVDGKNAGEIFQNDLWDSFGKGSWGDFVRILRKWKF